MPVTLRLEAILGAMSVPGQEKYRQCTALALAVALEPACGSPGFALAVLVPANPPSYEVSASKEDNGHAVVPAPIILQYSSLKTPERG